MSSALDNVALSLGDVIDAATQENGVIWWDRKSLGVGLFVFFWETVFFFEILVILSLGVFFGWFLWFIWVYFGIFSCLVVQMMQEESKTNNEVTV